MIVSEIFTAFDGRQLDKYYSDSGYKIRDKRDGEIYDECVVVEGTDINYFEETDEKIISEDILL